MRGSGLSLLMVQGGRWGGVLRQGRRPFPPAAAPRTSARMAVSLPLMLRQCCACATENSKRGSTAFSAPSSTRCSSGRRIASCASAFSGALWLLPPTALMATPAGSPSRRTCKGTVMVELLVEAAKLER